MPDLQDPYRFLSDMGSMRAGFPGGERHPHEHEEPGRRLSPHRPEGCHLTARRGAKSAPHRDTAIFPDQRTAILVSRRSSALSQRAVIHQMSKPAASGTLTSMSHFPANSRSRRHKPRAVTLPTNSWCHASSLDRFSSASGPYTS